MKKIIIVVLVLAVCAGLYFMSTSGQRKTGPAVATQAARVEADSDAAARPEVAVPGEKAPAGVAEVEEEKPEAAAPPLPVPVYVTEEEPARKPAASNVPSMEEQVEKVNKKIESIGKEFDFDSERTTDITQGVLMGVPPMGRTSAYYSFTNALKKNLKESETESVTVDEMTRAFERAFEELQMEDTEGMREMIRNYIENYESE